MALFIAAVIVFGIISVFLAKPAQNQATQNIANKTIVYLKLQDELFCYYFKKVVTTSRKRALQDYSPETSNRPLAFRFYMHLLHFYREYDIPDPRNNQRENEELKLLNTIRKSIEAGTYPKDDSNLSAEKLIWYTFWSSYRMNTKKPELLFGEPYTTHEEDGVTYKYNAHGRAEGFFVSETALMLIDIVTKITIKALKEYGYNYSNKREIPFEQEYHSDMSIYKLPNYVILKDPEDIKNYNEYGTDFTPTADLQKQMDATPNYKIINPECIINTYTRKPILMEYEQQDISSYNFSIGVTVIGVILTVASIIPIFQYLATPIYENWETCCYGIGFLVAGVTTLICGLICMPLTKGKHDKALQKLEDERKKARK